ncbi:MAG: hypothetical protein HY927_01850 [Elusimicrobia bacterium]|nr:hypothetical protein [Elusimicrobiota bacterium]
MKLLGQFVVALALACVGYLGYRFFFALPYGMTAEDPLGAYAGLHAHCTETMGLERPARQLLVDPEYAQPPGTGLVTYVLMAGGAAVETVNLAVDKSGKVRGLNAKFAYNHGNLSYPNKVGRFANGYWMLVTGDKPMFSGAKNLATFENAVLTGQFQLYSELNVGRMAVNMK